MTAFPLIGLLVAVLLYVYMRVIYRRVVVEVNENNHMEFTDLEHFHQQYATGNFLNYPLYIDNVMKNPKDARVSNINFHSYIFY